MSHVPSQPGQRHGRRSNIRLYCPARGTEGPGYSTGKLAPLVSAYHNESIIIAAVIIIVIILKYVLFVLSHRATTHMYVAAYDVVTYCCLSPHAT